MKFVAISDTHGKHKNLILPSGDVLIHAGDVTREGQEAEVVDFLKWFHEQDFRFKIFVAGNHDFYFERRPEEEINKLIPKGIIYLNDTGTTIGGIKIWGSPITPWFYDWAFNRNRGGPIKRHWDLIPADTKVLITHGPVFGILDITVGGQHVGCEDLLLKVREIAPEVHICGHIHEAYGAVEMDGTRFINASILNERYAMVNRPLVFEL